MGISVQQSKLKIHDRASRPRSIISESRCSVMNLKFSSVERIIVLIDVNAHISTTIKNMFFVVYRTWPQPQAGGSYVRHDGNAGKISIFE